MRWLSRPEIRLAMFITSDAFSIIGGFIPRQRREVWLQSQSRSALEG